MEDSHPENQTGIRKVMAQAVVVIVREREPLFLIIALTTVLGTVLAWPMLDNFWFIAVNPGMSEREGTVQLQAILDHSFLIILGLLLTQAASVVWTRIWSLGREQAMNGGMSSLMRRTLWATFRYFGLGIWTFIIAAMVALPVSFIAGIIMGIGGSTDSLSGFIIIILLYGSLTMVVGLVLTAYGWSIYGESRDQRSSIFANLLILKGRALPIGGGFLLASLVFIAIMLIPYTLLMGSLTETGGSGSVPVTFIIWYMTAGFAGSLFSFYWMTFSGLLLQQSKNTHLDIVI